MELKSVFENVETKFVVSLVNEETILKRYKERPKKYQMKERCILLLNDFLNNDYADSYILHTDNLTINKTIDEILNNKKYLIN